MELYSTKTVAEKAGVPYRTMMRWVKDGLITPYVYPGGSGRPALFSKKEFREVIILARLREFLSMQKLKEALAHLRSLGHNPLSTGEFAVVRDARGERALFKLCNTGEAIELIQENPQQIRLFPVFDIEELVDGTPPVRGAGTQAEYNRSSNR
ncbi:MAG: MerR family transcriptional regulator [Candidatus Bipolaricaulia bacterium]